MVLCGAAIRDIVLHAIASETNCGRPECLPHDTIRSNGQFDVHLKEGVAMKRLLSILFVAMALVLAGETATARADWGGSHYGGYQPWWNIFAKRHRHMSVEEERLQRFWHDYYDALRCYYDSLDNIDWVSYYKNHGYQINSQCGGPGCGPGGGGGRVMFAPVFVSPQMQWAVPNSTLTGTPGGPPGVPQGMYGMYR